MSPSDARKSDRHGHFHRSSRGLKQGMVQDLKPRRIRLV
jgi:hypothetical protein